MFEPLQTIETTVFARLPDEFRAPPKPSLWASQRGPHKLDGFLEGPCFGPDGMLYVVDIPYGRIFKVSPAAQWTLFAEYDGEPNGLRYTRDGRILVTDQKCGLVEFDPATGKHSILADRPFMQRFIGPNDLTVSKTGDIYFTDQGQSDYVKREGKVFRLRKDGQLETLIEGLPSPNGIVMNTAEDMLYVALTRTSEILAVPLKPNYGGLGRMHSFIKLSGGTGPDGIAMAEGDRLVVCQVGLGSVWLFDRHGLPTHRVASCTGMRTTNLTFGGPERKTLFITESESCTILKAEMPVKGNALY